MGKTSAIPMDKEIQNFLFIFTGQQYKTIMAEHHLLSSAIIYYNSKMLLDTYVIFYSISHLLFNIRLFQTITFLAIYNTQVQSK